MLHLYLSCFFYLFFMSSLSMSSCSSSSCSSNASFWHVSHKTVVTTPQQNGLAEGMNRTISERVRCMLMGAGLPKSLWREVTKPVIYLINRSPPCTLNCKTFVEVWSGRLTYYVNLRVFNTFTFEHVKKDELEAWDERCIFIGHIKDAKGYKLRRL